MPAITLRTFNNLLTFVVIVLALYILINPFWPNVSLWAKQRIDNTGGYTYQSRLSKTPAAAPIPQDNRLVIPSLLIDEPIKEGRDIKTINNGGTWRRPNTSDPSQDKNTVIVGHRYTYSGLSTFYNLDKLKQGDKIIIYWQGEEYDYRVSEIRVVAASTTEIEEPTTEPTLTLYTCTPLWSAKDRLVVTAKLMDNQ